eukprot:jgi/Galph1/2401/GphlegSOOS_G1035.1
MVSFVQKINRMTTQEDNSMLFQAFMGKVKLENNMLISDSRKGALQLWYLNHELHLLWKERTSDTVEEDVIITKGTLFELVPGVPDGTVYMLKLPEGTRRYYWLQEPQTKEKDGAYYCKKIEELITTKTAQLESTVNSASSSSIETNRQAITANALESVLQRLRGATSTTNLEQIVCSEQVLSLLQDSKLQPTASSLFELLPEDDRSVEGLQQVIRSAPFREQVSILNAALQSPYAGQVLISLGFPEAVNDGPDYVKAFIRAVIRKKNID